jgi:hypothetical protein
MFLQTELWENLEGDGRFVQWWRNVIGDVINLCLYLTDRYVCVFQNGLRLLQLSTNKVNIGV